MTGSSPVIDVRYQNDRLKDNTEFDVELKKRCDLLHSQGFIFIKATPWESLDNINNSRQYPEIDIEHIKWTGEYQLVLVLHVYQAQGQQIQLHT